MRSEATPSHPLPAIGVLHPASSRVGHGSRSPASLREVILRILAWASASQARTAQFGGTVVAAIGATALLGWLTGSRLLTSGAEGYIPMAPNTALVFIAMGLAQGTLAAGSRRGITIARWASGAGLVISGTRLIEYLTGTTVGVDSWLFSFPSESLGLAPVGRMAFFTALAFVIACSATFAVSSRASVRIAADFARACGIVTSLVGLVFALGYVYGSPLLYGSRSIPMALPTAVAFLVLGLTITVPLILAAAGERREADRALRAAHEELERRVEERTADLEVANEELQAMVVDLEERTEEAEEARQQALTAEGRYRTLVDGVALGVVLFTPDGIEAANPSAERILGLSLDQLRERSAVDPRWRVVQEDGSPFPPELYPAAVALRTGRPERNVIMGVHRPDETVAWIEVSADPVGGEGHEAPYASVTSFIDITERRRTEQALRLSEAKLRQAQKMEAIGQLAGGVAHDFNNMLTAIKSYAQLACEAGDMAAARLDMAEVCAAADRAAALTRQLLAFSRQQMLQPEILDLNEVARGFEPFLARLLGEDVECEARLAADLCSISADPGQIEQVLMNLAVNARDAMPNGGQLTIETANVQLDAHYAVRYPEVVPGPYVMLAVSDNGVGMDAETQERIFDPFFTTKPVGQGTGLGLSTVYGIVKQSDGHVTVYSEPGCGTTFRVYFPCELGEAAPRSAAVAEPETIAATGTVLLVEDDPAVRDVTARILSRAGYVVLEAPSPHEATAIAARHAGTIDLIMTDLVMPGMSGRELAQQLLLDRPGTPVLYMSGYTDDAVIRRGLLEPGMAFLAKPFASEAVLRKVGGAIHSRPGAGDVAQG